MQRRTWRFGLAAACLVPMACGGLNDAIMKAVFPATELSIEEDLDAKHKPEILVVEPAEAVPGKEVTIEIRGNHLASYRKPEGGQVWLTPATGQPQVRIVGRVDRHTQSQLRCVFDLRKAPTGSWDLHLKRGDGPTTAAKGAVKVRPLGQSD